MSVQKVAGGFGSGARTLGEGLLIAALYAVTCWATRQVSLDQFFLPAGVRIASLLLWPVRFWPYLLLGEYIYYGHLRFPLIENYGLSWVLISSAFQFPTAAGVVYLHRRQIARKTDTWLLSVASAAAVLIGTGTVLIAHLFWPVPPPGGIVAISFRSVLGDYVAILTVVPLAVLWKQRLEIDWLSFLNSRTAYVLLTLLALGFVSILLPHTSVERTTAQLLMAAPVIALTCLQGWLGAAIGMPLMNLFVRIGTPVTGLPYSFDLESFNIQLVAALSGTALLALGSRITHFFHQCTFHASASRQVISNARTSHSVVERELRNRAMDLRKIGDGLESALSETIEWLKVRGYHDMASGLLHVATVHSSKFRAQTSMVYPSSMEHVGLYLALQVGGLCDAWEETARVERLHLSGDPCRLDLDLQLNVYRAMTEAVSLLMEHERGKLRIRARCGRHGTTHGVVVTIGTADVRHRLSRTTVTMAIGRLSGRTQVYGGTVQCFPNRIRMSFADPSVC